MPTLNQSSIVTSSSSFAIFQVVTEEQLGLIMLSVIDCLNSLRNIDLARLVEISKDGLIDITEVDDFNELKKNLKKIARAYGSLMRWEEDGNTIGVPVPEPLDD